MVLKYEKSMELEEISELRNINGFKISKEYIKIIFYLNKNENTKENRIIDKGMGPVV